MIEPAKPMLTKSEARYSLVSTEKGKCRTCVSSHFMVGGSQIGSCDRLFGVIDRAAFCDEYKLRENARTN